jgi:hypothetical protein
MLESPSPKTGCRPAAPVLDLNLASDCALGFRVLTAFSGLPI